jgi:hypothetical protein
MFGYVWIAIHLGIRQDGTPLLASPSMDTLASTPIGLPFDGQNGTFLASFISFHRLNVA